ncbi:hypothetical protein BDL97_01G173100 [Sphagnum fallax]|nr:hypothetical protein BDL97_01G173100 [Sphagnum fallax]
MGRRCCSWFSWTQDAAAVTRQVTLWILIAAAAVQGDEGSAYLDEKETQVLLLAKQVEANYAQTCALVESCASAANCSRHACSPLLGESQSNTIQCVDVFNNKYCTNEPGNGTCTHLKANYGRSYLRLPPGTDLTNVPAAMGNSICSQRLLDSTFQTMSYPSVFTYVYFGAVDGTWRSFPGRESSTSDCLGYDPRIRPWYIEGISVTKNLVVLIDAGASMTNVLSTQFLMETTYLAAAQSITQKALLQTLSAQDYVNIIVFNSTGATQLSPDPVLVRNSDLSDPTDHSELKSLITSLNNQEGSSQAGASNLTAAIMAAFTNFNAHALKIIVVLTDGVFASSENVTLPESLLLASNVKILLYKLPQADDLDIYLSNNSLLNSICRVNGTFEVIQKDLTNPLYTVRSYFSYLAATLEVAVNGKPLWSNIYQDFEGIGYNITSVTSPAFGSDGQLLGVAAITVYINELGTLTDLVTTALQNRTKGNVYPTIVIANCSIATASNSIPAAQQCGSIAPPANGGLCNMTDFTSSLESMSCCSTCSAPGNASTVIIAAVNSPSRTVPKYVGAIVGGTIAGGLVVLVGMSVLRRGFCFSRENHNPSVLSSESEVVTMSVLSRVFCFSKGNHNPIVSSSERKQQDDIQEDRESPAEDSDMPLPPQRD